jgi:uncharacterized protein
MDIAAPHGRLEAVLRVPEGRPRGAAVLCHPHPLQGGTMHTKAVFRAAQALNEAGVVVLRFNFRGVGRSTGSFDGGVGEREDVRTAVDWLSNRHPELPLLAGGFSFGSGVAFSWGAEDDRIVALLGLGLPVEMTDYEFGYLAEVDKPVLVVQGEHDEFGAAARVAELVRGLGEHVTLIAIRGADHFFTDRLDELREAIRGYYATGPGARVLLDV